MKKVKDFILSHIPWIVIGIVIFILIYTMCDSNLYAQDEYNYSNITWTSQRLTSFRDVLSSMKILYFNWSGRLIALGLSQLFLFVGTGYYDILNSFVFVIFIFMIGKITGKKNTILKTLGALLLVSCFVPSFWQEFIWLTASFNYLWPVTFMLITMYYFYNIIINDKKISKLERVIFYFFSFCAGLSHENTAFVTGMFIIIIGLVNIKKIWKWDIKEKIKIIAPVIIFGIGAMILIFAPGNFSRLDSSGTGFNLSGVISNIKLIKWLIVIWFVTSVMVFFLSKKSRSSLKNNFIYFILPMGFAMIPMLIIQEFPIRAMLAYEACLLIFTVDNIGELEELLKNKKVLMAVTIIVGIIAFIPLMYKAWFAKKYLEPYREKMEYQLNYCKVSGMDEAVIEQFDKLEKAQELELYMDMFAKNQDISIINSYMATYYGFEKVTAIPEGTVLIEIDITGEEELVEYTLVRRDTEEVYSARFMGSELQMPNLTYQNRICFLIPEFELDNVRVDLPEDIIQSVTSVTLKRIGSIEEISIQDLLD